MVVLDDQPANVAPFASATSCAGVESGSVALSKSCTGNWRGAAGDEIKRVFAGKEYQPVGERDFVGGKTQEFLELRQVGAGDRHSFQPREELMYDWSLIKHARVR